MPMFQRRSPARLVDSSARRPFGRSAAAGLICAAVVLAVAPRSGCAAIDPTGAMQDPTGAIQTASPARSVGSPSSRATFCEWQRWPNGDHQCLSNTSIRQLRVMVRLADNLATAPDLYGPASLDNETVVEMDGARTQADIRELRSSTEKRSSATATLAGSEGVGHRPRGKMARIRADHIRAVQASTYMNQNRFLRRWTQTTSRLTSPEGAGRVISRPGKVMRGRYDPSAYAYSPHH